MYSSDKVVPVVFFEKFEMWAAPDILGMAKYELARSPQARHAQAVAAERGPRKRSVIRAAARNIAPKSATEVFG